MVLYFDGSSNKMVKKKKTKSKLTNLQKKNVRTIHFKIINKENPILTIATSYFVRQIVNMCNGRLSQISLKILYLFDSFSNYLHTKEEKVEIFLKYSSIQFLRDNNEA